MFDGTYDSNKKLTVFSLLSTLPCFLSAKRFVKMQSCRISLCRRHSLTAVTRFGNIIAYIFQPRTPIRRSFIDPARRFHYQSNTRLFARVVFAHNHYAENLRHISSPSIDMPLCCTFALIINDRVGSAWFYSIAKSSIGTYITRRPDIRSTIEICNQNYFAFYLNCNQLYGKL